MARLLRISVAVLLCIGLGAGAAAAATTAEQLVALSRAGLDDDILIALIQTDGSTFQLSADDLLELRRQGLSNRVIRAMQATAPRIPAVPQAPPREPERRYQGAEPVHAEAPTAPGAVHVIQTISQRVGTPVGYGVPVYVPIYVRPPTTVRSPVTSKPAPPVYWGWGGQRRPDSWDDGQRRGRSDRSKDR